MKLNSPLPQSLPKECDKAAKIFQAFVDSGNNGLDGVIPRGVLENAKGFAIFTIFKAGFLFSARAGSGIVIARMDDGSWSAPSAIGTAGLGVGGQAGAEMTDFLIVLNSRSAVRSFMAAGSLTLGGNLSVAVGPLGRNGEAVGSVNSSGKLAAMYSYSKTRGLFGGVSLEGSVIMERQDANAQAYHSDVTAKMLLSGAVPPPEWTSRLIQTLESCTGLPGNRRWVQEHNSQNQDEAYIFDSVRNTRNGSGSAAAKLKKKEVFPPTSWGRKKATGSYFSSDRDQDQDCSASSTHSRSKSYVDDPWESRRAAPNKPSTAFFDTQFESDFMSDEELRKHPQLKPSPKSTVQHELPGDESWQPGSPFNTLPPFDVARLALSKSDSPSHRRVMSEYVPSPSFRGRNNPFASSVSRSGPIALPLSDDLGDVDVFGTPSPYNNKLSQPRLTPKPELARPLELQEGVARAIALYDFTAVQPGDLSFKQGQVITVVEKSDSTETWWKGKLEGKEGIFPANFVEVV